MSGSIGVICVVSRYHLDDPAGLLGFFEDLGVNVRFNMVYSPDWPFHITYSEYFEFLSQLAITWLNWQESMIRVDPIASDVEAILTGVTSSCDRTDKCYDRFVTIDPDGNLYPCNRFAGDLSWKYGTLLDLDLNSLWNNVAPSYFAPVDDLLNRCKLVSTSFGTEKGHRLPRQTSL